MYQEGKTRNDIARHLGLHRTTVRAILDRVGTTIRSRTLTPTQVRLATTLYGQGLMPKETRGRLGLTAETVSKRLREKSASVPSHQQYGLA